MLTLTLRTDKPEAEIGLYNNAVQLTYHSWLAHRQLAETIHLKIKEVLDRQSKELQNIEAIVVYQGPGSFTGLRIGVSVANALADGLGIPIIGTSGDNWLDSGLERLRNGENQTLVSPLYGAEAHITVQKK